VKIANVDGGINVSWTKATGATGYRVYRSQYDVKTSTWTSWKNMGTAKANKTSWVDKSVVDGTTYKYTVRSVNGNVLSSYAASSNLKFLKTPKLLSCVNTEDGIVVSFEKNKNVDSYNVYRKTNYTNWVLLATISDTEYTDKDVIQGTEYIYTVRSISGKSMSYYNKTGISVQV
jgi:fibronectin type 3 domain-containing protein